MKKEQKKEFKLNLNILIIIIFFMVSGCNNNSPIKFKSKSASKQIIVGNKHNDNKPTGNQKNETTSNIKKERKENKDPFIEFCNFLNENKQTCKLIWKLHKSNMYHKVMAKLFKKNKKIAIRSLIKTLKYDNNNIKIQAVRILIKSKIASDKIADSLILLLSSETNHDVLSFILEDLSGYRGKKKQQIAKLALKLLKTNSDKMVRAYAAYALGYMHYTPAIPFIIKALHDPESWVRLLSLTALKKMRVKKAVPEIKKLLNDPNERVKTRAAEVLKYL